MTGHQIAELKGDIPSFYLAGVDCYSTNYGSIQTVSCTGKVISACIGFSNYNVEGGYKHFTIRILQNSYSIRTGTLYKEYTEIASSNYPYKLSYADKTNLAKVFDMIRTSGKLSRAIIAVILTLRQLMGDKLTGADKKAMDNLLDHIRQFHSLSIPRQPIVKRAPIQKGGEGK